MTFLVLITGINKLSAKAHVTLHVIQIVFQRTSAYINMQSESLKKLPTQRNKRTIIISDHKTNSNLIVCSLLEHYPANNTMLELLQGI